MWRAGGAKEMEESQIDDFFIRRNANRLTSARGSTFSYSWVKKSSVIARGVDFIKLSSPSLPP